MKKKKSDLWLISLMLVTLSFIGYGVHYLIFHDVYHIFFYLLIDVGFLFLNVLVVIIFIERLLAQREKRMKMRKLNMVIGTFFSEVGLDLLKIFSALLENAERLKELLDIQPDWTPKDFRKAAAAAKDMTFTGRIPLASLEELRSILSAKREFMTRLLENPNLLEHERFTDLLWATFHLAEELAFRGENLEDLPQTDYDHLMIDVRRAFSHITIEWLAYAEHLKSSYPYLFSLAARINPLGAHPSPVVKSS